MKVAVMGQAAFGAAVLERLKADAIDVVAVSAPKPAEGARPDALWQAAVDAAIPAIDTKSLKTDDGMAAWRDAGADLAVMAFVTEILPNELFAMPTHGTIQYHPSLLPLHRGSSAINWAIINGRRETGLTIFWPDEGIDTGPILLQKTCPIGPGDTVGSVYFNHLFPMGVEAIAESVQLIASGKAPRIEQDHARSTYEPPCGDKHAAIRWYEPADRVYALIRGCNPQPGAYTPFNGSTLRIFDCTLTGSEEPGMPGRVLRVEDDGVFVRLNGGVLRLERVAPEGGKKMPAAEWAAAADVGPRTRLR
jgi:methionyl-tRNA formyltransferase